MRVHKATIPNKAGVTIALTEEEASLLKLSVKVYFRKPSDVSDKRHKKFYSFNDELWCALDQAGVSSYED